MRCRKLVVVNKTMRRSSLSQLRAPHSNVLEATSVIYLALNIVLSSCFILCIKWVQLRKDDTISVGMINYLVAAVGAALCLEKSTIPFSWPAILTGAINGSCYFIAFFFLIHAVLWKGVANIAVVSRLSIVLPLIAGVVVWGERPGMLQALGILLACAALCLIGRRQSDAGTETAPKFAILVLAGFFVIAGGSRLAQEMFKHVGHPSQQPVFLLVAFGLAATAAVTTQLIRQKSPTPANWLFGSALGIINLGQTHCILKALEFHPGFIVFPVTSAGGLLLTTLVAVILFRERLGWPSFAGIGLAATSLALLHS